MIEVILSSYYYFMEEKSKTPLLVVFFFMFMVPLIGHNTQHTHNRQRMIAYDYATHTHNTRNHLL